MQPALGQAAFVLRGALDRIIATLQPQADPRQEPLRNPVEILTELIQTASELRTLAAAPGAENEKLLSRCREIRENADFFLNRLEPGRSIPEPYLRSLESDLQLARLARGARSTDERLEHAEAVADDLKIKRKWAENNDAFGLIDVTARTKDGDQEIQGLYVYYEGAGWRKIGKYINRFDRQSSPTNAKIPPGEYYLWTQRGNSQKRGRLFYFRGRRPT